MNLRNCIQIIKQHENIEINQVFYFEGRPHEFVDYYAPTELSIGFMAILYPKNYYLLTAIDIESEGKLTGIDFTDLERELDGEEAREVEMFLSYRNDPPVIPILQRSELNIPLYLSLTVDEIVVDVKEYKDKYNVQLESPMFTIDEDRELEFFEEVSNAPILSTKHYDINLSDSQHPFNGTHLQLNENFQIEKKEGGSLGNDSSVYYTASKIKYDIQGEMIKAAKVEDKQPPLYKELEQHGESYMERMSAPFMLWQMGTFSPPSDKNQLVSSPLGIYSTEDVITAEGETLVPTITPGSFIPQPAAGVTTIEAAELIKGDKPIDAIRIRVAGFDTYNADAQLKIERVATALFEKGYEVDIVAGSSFMDFDMDVEGVGLVAAPWTTLGVAQKLSLEWNILTLTNILLFSLFGVAWFAVRLLYERNSISAENEILRLLGWRKNKIKLRNIIEQLLIIMSAFTISACLLLFLQLETKLIVYLSAVLLLLISTVFIWMIFSKNSKESNRTVAYKKEFSFIHYRHLIMPIMLVLMISFILIAIQIASIIASVSESSVTTLGAFTMDATFYLQMIILFATILLVIISVSEAITAIINARKIEFQLYHTIGWGRKMILKHFGREVSLWAGVSIIVGGALSITILYNLGMQNNWIFIGSLSSLVLIVLPLIAIVMTKKYGES